MLVGQESTVSRPLWTGGGTVIFDPRAFIDPDIVSPVNAPSSYHSLEIHRVFKYCNDSN